MKRLLLLASLLLPGSAARAQDPPIQCPGSNTVEMRYCAERAWQQSDGQLRRQLPAPLLRQWVAATRAVCEQAYRPYKDGTIYPQLVVGCDDQLNRALLQQFQGLEAR